MIRALLLAAVGVTAACSGGSPHTETARQDTPRSGTTASAGYECVRGEPQPALVGTGPAAGRPRFERTGTLDATEDARLDDTTSVRITHTGCAHYVQRFAFTVRGAVRDTADTRYWLEQGARYLEALPAVEDMRAQLADMAAALRSASAASPPYVYGNGAQASELAQVFLTVRTVATNAVMVEIVFDYSL